MKLNVRYQENENNSEKAERVLSKGIELNSKEAIDQQKNRNAELIKEIQILNTKRKLMFNNEDGPIPNSKLGEILMAKSHSIQKLAKDKYQDETS